MAETDDAKMSFMEHLGELRTRIVWSLVPAGIGLLIAFYFTDRIMKFLSRPVAAMHMKLVFTKPQLNLKLCLLRRP